MTTSTRVLYVAGWGRSGSTLLSRLVSTHPDVVFVGELRDLWHRGVDEDRPCGCGATFHTCEFWSAVGERAYGGWATQDVEAMKDLRTRADRPWTPTALARGWVPPGRRDDVAAYMGMLGTVLAAIDEVTGGRTILDSSKIPSFAWLLGAVPGVDLRSVHLVRDPRGVVHSWKKSVGEDTADGQPTYMVRYSPVTAVARYDLYNLQANHLDRVGPRMLLRYEDVVREPRRALVDVAGFAGLTEPDLSEVTSDPPAAVLGPSHSVVGNPMRMQTGAVPLRPDTAWRDGLDDTTRRLVTAATWPLLRTYGYEVAP